MDHLSPKTRERLIAAAVDTWEVASAGQLAPLRDRPDGPPFPGLAWAMFVKGYGDAEALRQFVQTNEEEIGRRLLENRALMEGTRGPGST